LNLEKSTILADKMAAAATAKWQQLFLNTVLMAAGAA
jgi:hypothetical protein